MARAVSYPNPFRPVEPGLEVTLSRWLIPAYLLGVGLPAVAAWLAAVASNAHWHPVIEAATFGLAAFDAMMVFALALGCLIVTLMKARPRVADPMPLPED